jgi:hypothetical protein
MAERKWGAIRERCDLRLPRDDHRLLRGPQGLLAEEIADDLRSALEQVESVLGDLRQRAASARGG